MTPAKAKGSETPRTPEPIGFPRSILPNEFPRSADMHRPCEVAGQGLFGFCAIFSDAPLISNEETDMKVGYGIGTTLFFQKQPSGNSAGFALDYHSILGSMLGAEIRF